MSRAHRHVMDCSRHWRFVNPRVLALGTLAVLLAGCKGSGETQGAPGSAGGAGSEQDASLDQSVVDTGGIDTGLLGDGSADAELLDAPNDAQPDLYHPTLLCPTVGEGRCQNGSVFVCAADEKGNQDWRLSNFCSIDTEECVEAGGIAHCQVRPTCKDSTKNQDETGVDCGGADCGPCTAGQGCLTPDDCESAACDQGVCKLCQAGTFSCDGAEVRRCTADQSAWESVSSCGTTQVCNAQTGSCTAPVMTGTMQVTGNYYMYALFNSGNSPWGTGYDVDSYGNKIYAIHGSSTINEYQVDIMDSDGDGVINPNQHPDNPDARGPIERRTLTLLKTYSNVPLGAASTCELYADDGRIFFIKGGSVYQYVLATGVTTTVATGNGLNTSFLGYDPFRGTWFSGNEGGRQVYSMIPSQGRWSTSFRFPDMAGSHFDGLEVVPDPNDKTVYVYVSDMTSDYIGQYRFDPKTYKWTQSNLFQYSAPGAGEVEGMGFGAFNHFWATGGHTLYELGGGKLQTYVEPS